VQRGELEHEHDGTEAEGRQVGLARVGDLHAGRGDRDSGDVVGELDVVCLPGQHRHGSHRRAGRRHTSP
jgi:hypothetical protein